MTKDFDRDQIIFTITLMTNYSEGYLQGLSDEWGIGNKKDRISPVQPNLLYHRRGSVGKN